MDEQRIPETVKFKENLKQDITESLNRASDQHGTPLRQPFYDTVINNVFKLLEQRGYTEEVMGTWQPAETGQAAGSQR